MSSERRRVVVEQRVELAVALSVELEVRRPCRLALGDDGDERVLAHRLQRVVRSPLLADRRAGLARQLLAARGAGAVRGEDAGRVGQRQQLVVQRVVEAGAPARRPRAPTRRRRAGPGRPTSPTNSVSPVSTP